jgi:hypothetical protein
MPVSPPRQRSNAMRPFCTDHRGPPAPSSAAGRVGTGAEAAVEVRKGRGGQIWLGFSMCLMEREHGSA